MTEADTTDAEEIHRQDQARSLASEVLTGGRLAPGLIGLEPLAGMTNRNYLVTVEGKRYVVRIPGAGTSDYIDRRADEQASRLTAEIGVGVPLVHYDAARGMQITEYIEGSRDMRSPGVLDAPEAIRRAARAFKRLHGCGRQFLNPFDEKTVAEEYLEILRAKGAALPEGYAQAQKDAETIRAVLNATCPARVPCHNDPAPENLLDDGARAYIIDWEFGGNNDPYWDLGDFSVEAGFTTEQDHTLLEAYCGRAPTEAETARLQLQKSLVFLLWTLWGVLQHVNKNPRPAYHFASYWDYAMHRFTHSQEITQRADFGRMLEAVRNG